METGYRAYPAGVIGRPRIFAMRTASSLASSPCSPRRAARVASASATAPASTSASRASMPSAMMRSASSTSASTIWASGTTRTTWPRTNRWPFAPPGGDAEVGLPGLAGAVDHAAHDRHLEGDVALGQGRLGLLGDPDHVDLGPPAGRAGDQVEALALPQPEGLEKLAAGPGLLHRIGGQRVADGVADALGQQGADPGRRLDEPVRRRPRLGHAEVQRVVDRVGQQPVGVDHQRHRRRLHRDLHVGETDLLEQRQLAGGAGHQRLGRGAAVALVERRVEAAGVDPDADRQAPVLRLPGHRADVVGLADVARVEAQARHPGLHGGQGQLVLEVDVGDEGDGRAGDDLGQPLGRLLLVAGAAHDVGPRRRQGVDLGQGPVDVGRLGGGHRLDGDGRVAAHGHGADVDLPGLARRGCTAPPAYDAGRGGTVWRVRSFYGASTGRKMSRYSADRPMITRTARTAAVIGMSFWTSTMTRRPLIIEAIFS